MVVRGFFSFMIDMLVPPLCVHCGSEIPAETSLMGASIPEGLSPAIFSFLDREPVMLCRDCLLGLDTAPNPCPLSTGAGAPNTIHLVTPFFTNEVLLSVVRFLKFEGGVPAADPLSWWMAWALERCVGPSGGSTLLIPVPLHRRRRRGRGYNQAALLSRRVAGRLGLPCDDRILVRCRHTKSQTRLAEAERDRNVRGAFRIATELSIHGRHVILVDDLVTSGSTVRSCIDAIIPAGPARVTVLAGGRRKACSYTKIGDNVSGAQGLDRVISRGGHHHDRP